MMHAPLFVPVLALVLSSGPLPRADTLDALGPALTACFRAPDGSAGSQVTVLLSLRANGTVLGMPRITYSHLVGSADAKRAFLTSVLGSLRACTPVALTPALGGAIAGHLIAIRFVGGGPAQAI